jgi:anti-anti-sigma regulatory factor
MVEGIQLAEQHQKKFMLTRVHSEQVIHTFEIARLTDLFPHFESPKRAIEENNQQGEE